MMVIRAICNKIKSVLKIILVYAPQITLGLVVAISFCIGRYSTLGLWQSIIILIIGIVLVGILSVVKEIHGRGKQIPVPPYRFTEDDDDTLSIRNQDLQPVIVYLHEIEQYLDNIGVRIPNPPDVDKKA